MDIEKLKNWFLKEKRDFPWRKSPSPYEVWISEVMLQQTQASVVVDYFTKWLSIFPTIDALAAAPIEEVIKAWEGLGYYSRARNLHKGAKIVIERHQGDLPANFNDLISIPGIGMYTAGAILSFAYHQKAAAIDGNVMRVVTRFFCIEEEISQPATIKSIRDKVEKLLPDHHPWIIMEALIELGAKICKKRPVCHLCPVKQECLGKEKALVLPHKIKKTSIIKLKRYVALIAKEGEILVGKGDSGKVMADLYEFPYWENTMAIEELGLKLTFIRELPIQKHSFTRFQAELIPSLWEAKEKLPVNRFEWVSIDNLSKLPFSSGHRRILQGFLYAYFAH